MQIARSWDGALRMELEGFVGCWDSGADDVGALLRAPSSTLNGRRFHKRARGHGAIGLWLSKCMILYPSQTMGARSLLALSSNECWTSAEPTRALAVRMLMRAALAMMDARAPRRLVYAAFVMTKAEIVPWVDVSMSRAVMARGAIQYAPYVIRNGTHPLTTALK